MDDDRANVVRMCFEGSDLFGGIVIVDTKLEVIRTADNPVLPRNESTSTDRDIGELECFDDRLGKLDLAMPASEQHRRPTCDSYDQM